MRFIRTAENLFGLPLGFTRVEYLQSTGTQYIDTGVIPNNTTKSELSFYVSGYPSTATNALVAFGSRTSTTSSDKYLFMTYLTASPHYARYDYGVENLTSTNIFSAGDYTFIKDGKDNYLNGTLVSSNTAATFTGAYSMYLFALNTANTADYLLPMRVKRFKITNNSVLVRDFIPCTDTLGVACMYDLVGKKPYYNQGTGEFTVGRQIIPVKYLESTGTQYIDAGYTLNNNSIIEISAQSTDVSQSDNTLLGVGSGSGSTDRVQVHFGTSAGYLVLRLDGTMSALQNTGTNRFTAKIDIPNKKAYFNDTEVISTYSGAINETNHIALFNRMINGNVVESRYASKAKVYYLRISENNAPVRDFIPCKDENNVGFMFDKVSGTCYLNAGTGSFSVGEPVYTSKLRLIKDAIRIPEGYTRVEYLESTGTQYIDTGLTIPEVTRAEITAMPTISGTDWIFGAYRSGYYDFSCAQSTENVIVADIGVSTGATSVGTGRVKSNVESYNNKIKVVIDRTDGSLTVNDILQGNTTTYTNTPTDYPLYLGARYNPTGSPGILTGRLYGCKMHNGTLVRSFIPVRDSNNVGYMFDEVTGQLFGNAGSGSFGVGNDLPTAKVRFIQDVLPREYRPLKYLQSTGTQYILTGFTPTVNTDFELELSSIKTSTNWAMGCPTWVGVHYKGADGQIGITNHSTSDYQRYVNYARDNTRITMKLQGNTVYANGVSLGTITRIAGNLDFALFGYRDANRGATLLFTGSIYKCIIWDNGVPVRDFYPALRKSDNKPGMYDRITKQFFTNHGTGEFSYE